MHRKTPPSTSWCEGINTENGVFVIADGVLSWLDKAQVKQFFSMPADNFLNGEIVFDVGSKVDNNFEAWVS